MNLAAARAALDQQLFVRVLVVAVLLDLDERTVRRQLAAGELPGFRVGSSWRIPTAAIRAMAGIPDSSEPGAATPGSLATNPRPHQERDDTHHAPLRPAG